ncbi:hypothetical protein BRD01_07685 [Halobacteriales archaeon QS_8_65_32]|nr:MAG: hypothetical protein BRD01_07685 [Halobacteriales archaeon QS_8_65_32]
MNVTSRSWNWSTNVRPKPETPRCSCSSFRPPLVLAGYEEGQCGHGGTLDADGCKRAACVSLPAFARPTVGVRRWYRFDRTQRIDGR